MATAMLSLIGLFVALYLSLWKIGLMGPMLCGTGSCETVQASRYAYVLGMPVAFYGVGGFLSILAVSLVGLQPKFAATRGPTNITSVFAVALIGLKERLPDTSH